VIPLCLLAAVLVIAGFWPSYFGPLLRGSGSKPWFIHLHAALFLGWIALVVAQAHFAASGRMALHIKTGRIGFLYGVGIVASGVGLSLYLFAHLAATEGYGALRVPLLAALTDMTAFSIFLTGAWVTRRRPDRHRRFILLATNALIIAGVARLFGGTASVAFADVAPMLGVWLSPVWIAMARDALRERRVHGVYVFGVCVLCALRYRHVLRETEAWNRFLHWLAERFM
jgi:FtsH-binding integral membrane protein